MKAYQQRFIEIALDASVLKFGQFTLKSGRVSPYFFNAGLFHKGKQLALLGRFYAESLIESGSDFSMLFGPAYKGIPLAAATAIAFSEKHNRDYPYGYNRKETKAHGEGGNLVGAPLEGDVAIIDDVITAGTAIREVLALIDQHGARAAAIAVGLDRQERGTGELSAIQELQQQTGVAVTSIVKLEHIIEYLHASGERKHLQSIETYRQDYGV